VITWTERPEMYLGVPTVVLVAKARGRIISARYWPKLKGVDVGKEWIIAFAERYFSDHDVTTGRPMCEGIEPDVEHRLTNCESHYVLEPVSSP
jgi:hypothetical protein